MVDGPFPKQRKITLTVARPTSNELEAADCLLQLHSASDCFVSAGRAYCERISLRDGSPTSSHGDISLSSFPVANLHLGLLLSLVHDEDLTEYEKPCFIEEENSRLKLELMELKKTVETRHCLVDRT